MKSNAMSTIFPIHFKFSSQKIHKEKEIKPIISRLVNRARFALLLNIENEKLIAVERFLIYFYPG